MKYCPNCGTQVQDGVTFCPNCGSQMNGQNSSNASVNQNQNVGGRPVVQNRNLATAIILSVVTCGIYALVWFFNLINDVNTVCQDDKSNQSAGTVFLLTLVTCGIYGIIWFYQVGSRMHAAGQRYGVQVDDNSTLYLILSIIGFQFIDYCLVQSDLNKFSNQ